jgi:hypothetical protein
MHKGNLQYFYKMKGAVLFWGQIIETTVLFFVIPWIFLTLSIYPIINKLVFERMTSILWLYIPASPVLFIILVLLDWLGLKFFRHN